MDRQDMVEKTKISRLKVSEKISSEFHREYLNMDTDEEEFGHQETPEPLDEAPPEPDKPVFTTSELDTLITFVKELTVLPNLTEADWSVECAMVIREYFCDPTKIILTIFFHQNNLYALLDYPHVTDNGLVYFLRDSWQIYRASNFMNTVTFGSINERIENAVMKFTEGLYASLAFKSDDWPEIMRDEIFSNLNDFLIRAIDITYQPLGILILYVPWEGIKTEQIKENLKIETKNMTRIKRQTEQNLLINRLEKVARTWIKQIRETLKVLPILSEELYDVTSEFEFWQSRYENLSCVSRQLESDRFVLIIKQLKRVKSSSINDLKILVSRIKNSVEEAKSNLTYLDIILEKCKALDSPEKIENCLPNILHITRFIWDESRYYNKSDNIERLLSSLSVHIVKICVNSIDLKLIFDDPNKCREIITSSLSCCKSYSDIYDNIISKCMNEGNNWKVNKEIVFNNIYAFEQRCQDVSEICETIIIYGSLNKINIGGTRGNQHEMQYRRVTDYFSQIISEMQISCDYALNITKISWFQDISNFRCYITELENTVKNLLHSLFEDVKTVEMGIETLYTLLKFRERPSFHDILRHKWTQVWKIFFKEIKICSLPSKECETIIMEQLKLLQSESSLISLIDKNYLTKLHKMMVNASDWLGDCDIESEALSNYLHKKMMS